MRWRIPDGHKDLINQEITFMASFEQAEEIANSILTHIASKKPRVIDPPSENDPVPGSP